MSNELPPLQRYTATTNHGEPWIEPDPDGDLVMYEDARAAVAAEREACAALCERRVTYWHRDDVRREEDELCAIAIRARATMQTHAPSAR